MNWINLIYKQLLEENLGGKMFVNCQKFVKFINICTIRLLKKIRLMKNTNSHNKLQARTQLHRISVLTVLRIYISGSFKLPEMYIEQLRLLAE